MIALVVILTTLTQWSASGFTVRSPHRNNALKNKAVMLAGKDDKNLASIKDDNDYLASFFTGGIFDKESQGEAIKLASKIKNVKTLGWKSTPLKRGKTRPRHRAFGGEGEKPIQLKPNYDESSQYCAEKWLTQEDMNAYLKCTDGPASDTVYVALAKGAKYAERNVCEATVQSWYAGKSFDQGAFLKSVEKGRQELIIGWVLYFIISGTAAAGIIFPNNPLNKQLEAFIDFVRLN